MLDWIPRNCWARKLDFFNWRDAVVDGAQEELLELVEVQVRNSFRAQHMIPDQHKTSEVVAMMVETGGAQVSEVFSMKR